MATRPTIIYFDASGLGRDVLSQAILGSAFVTKTDIQLRDPRQVKRSPAEKSATAVIVGPGDKFNAVIEMYGGVAEIFVMEGEDPVRFSHGDQSKEFSLTAVAAGEAVKWLRDAAGDPLYEKESKDFHGRMDTGHFDDPVAPAASLDPLPSRGEPVGDPVEPLESPAPTKKGRKKAAGG